MKKETTIDEQSLRRHAVFFVTTFLQSLEYYVYANRTKDTAVECDTGILKVYLERIGRLYPGWNRRKYLKLKGKKISPLFPENFQEIYYDIIRFGLRIFLYNKETLCIPEWHGETSPPAAIVFKYTQFVNKLLEQLFTNLEKNAQYIDNEMNYNNFDDILVTVYNGADLSQLHSERESTNDDIKLDSEIKNKKHNTGAEKTRMEQEFLKSCNEKNSILEAIRKDENRDHELLGVPMGTGTYVPRRECTNEITTKLEKHNLVVIAGLRGSGKTQLSIKVAEAFLKNNNVFWIEGTSAELIEKAFENIYEHIFAKPPTQEEDTFGMLTRRLMSSPTLLIFDDVPCLATIEKYIPNQVKASKLKILITSTTKYWYRDRGCPELVVLDKMNIEEASRLFLLYSKYLIKMDCKYPLISYDIQLSSIKTLMENIPRYPLVVKQSAEYILSSKNIKEVIADDELIKQLLDFESKHENSMYATFVLTFEEFEKQLYSFGKDSYKRSVATTALEIVNAWSSYGPKKIPTAHFKEYCNEKNIPKEEFFFDVIDLLKKKMIINICDNHKNMDMDMVLLTVNRKRLENTDPHDVVAHNSKKLLERLKFNFTKTEPNTFDKISHCST